MATSLDASLEKITELIEVELRLKDTHGYEYNMNVSEKVVILSAEDHKDELAVPFQKELTNKFKVGEYLVCKFNYFNSSPDQEKLDRLVLALEILKGNL